MDNDNTLEDEVPPEFDERWLYSEVAAENRVLLECLADWVGAHRREQERGPGPDKYHTAHRVNVALAWLAVELARENPRLFHERYAAFIDDKRRRFERWRMDSPASGKSPESPVSPASAAPAQFFANGEAGGGALGVGGVARESGMVEVSAAGASILLTGDFAALIAPAGAGDAVGPNAPGAVDGRAGGIDRAFDPADPEVYDETGLRSGDMEDYRLLCDHWRSRIAARSHHYLSDAHRREIARQMAGAPAFTELWVIEREGKPAAFMMLNGNNIAALYVEPGQQLHGLGTTLLRHARALCGANATLRTVVHDRNLEGLAFFVGHGFKVEQSRATDSAGLPIYSHYFAQPGRRGK